MLPADWWIQWRDDEPVHTALVQAHCVYWSGCVDEALSENEQRGVSPLNWDDVAAALYRDAKNLRRWYRGKQYRYAPDAFLGLAATIQIEVSELFPANLTWIANTIRLLCGRSGPTAEFSTDDCRVLAACCLIQSGPEPLCLADASIAAAISRCGNGIDQVRASAVTRNVYNQLRRHLAELEERH